MGMSFEEKGAYMDLLMMQFNRGHMTEHMIRHVVGHLWDTIQHKFKQDAEGLWYNERLDIEKERRKSYTDSRKNNKEGKNQYNKKSGHMTKHMTGHMENENINVNESIIEDSKELFNELKKTFLEFYKLKTENEYYFTAKDASNLKQLGKKLIHSIRNKGDTPTIQDAVNALSYIMQHHNDKWIDANFSIPILNSKYNEIISGIKQRHVKGTSDQQLAEILAKHING